MGIDASITKKDDLSPAHAVFINDPFLSERVGLRAHDAH
jgi:hypothetical protein